VRERRGMTLIDRHLLARLAPVMAAALAVALAALLIERLLRLLDLMTGYGAGLGPVMALVLNLVPHYLGLALPAAFCVGVLGVLGRMARDAELDALEAAGWSLRRIGAPFLVAGVALALLSLLISGVIQPYSRHAYRATLHAVVNAGWSGRVEPGVFIDLGRGAVLSALDVDATGRILTRVLLIEPRAGGETGGEMGGGAGGGAGGGETVVTAARGLVEPDPAAGRVRIVLLDGRALTRGGGLLRFERLQMAQDFALDANPFRPRDGPREMTFPELWARARGRDGFPPDPVHAAELHSRLVRALSMPGVALLAVPLGVARKRTPGWPRLLIALAALAGYHNALNVAAGLSAAGALGPVAALWALGAAFLGLSGALYLSTPGQGARSPLQRLFRAAEALTLAVGRRKGPA